MGTVYLAERDDGQFHQQVAIKLVTRGMDTAELLRRFRNERQILARLDHPNIARLLDGGSTADGRPFLVMEYVQGKTITAYCADCGMTARRRIELFRKVCAAVESAHQNLVVHRDLKPGNILVDADGAPKLLDFGIAKLLGPDDAGQFTITGGGMQILTPDYASPEQVRGEPITTATDVYSLGTILYELLTGSRAHRITTLTPAAVAQAVCEEEIVPPSVAARTTPSAPASPAELAGDLDNILLTALRKDRHERYGSVQQFSEDLRRYLEDLPVLARPQTLRYRAVKFARRNRVPVIAAAMVFASLVGGIAFSTYEARRAARRYQEVRGLANSFLFEIHDLIETLPGATLAREAMVRKALLYLNSLARDSGGDPSLQFELANAYLKIGDLQGYAPRPNLGQFDAALVSYRKALAIAEQLGARDADPRIQRMLAVAHHRIGYLMRVQRLEAGLEHYGRALELLDPLYRKQPGNSEDSPLLITLYGHRGDVEMMLGRVADAAASWQRTLDIATSWSLQDSGDAARVALATGHRRVSLGLQSAGDLAPAMQHIREAVALQEALSNSQPANALRRRDLMNSYEQLSRIAGHPDYLNLGDRQTALAFNGKVVAIAEALSLADASDRMALGDLVIAVRDTCIMMSGSDPLRVVERCRKALEIGARRDMVDSETAYTGPALALALQKLGRNGEALEMGRRAVQAQGRRMEREQGRSDMVLELLRIHNRIGEMSLAMRDYRAALDHYHEAVALGQDLLRSRPSDLVLYRDLADCYENLGRWYERRDRAQAREWYRKSLDIWSAWPRTAVSTSFDRQRREQAARAVSRCDAALAHTPSRP